MGCETETPGGLFVRPYGRAASAVWLLFLGFPLSSLLSARVSTAHLALALAGFAAAVAIYAVLLLDQRHHLPRDTARGLVLALLALGVAMSALDRLGWATIVVYCVAAISIKRLFTERTMIAVALGGTVAATGAAALKGASAGASVGEAISVAVSCAGVGLLLIVISQLRSRNLELVRARGELARLAVAEERLRFARDMHDLLGHSLSVIALKAELVGRLIDRDTDAARAHVSELEDVARGALAEVREAVSGYRKPVLAAELDGAKMALEDAGIRTQTVSPRHSLSPEVEALLAWTVREGATNVIRHSDARNCRLLIECGPDAASAAVIDDGNGPHEGNGRAQQATGEHLGGHGLAGLRERAERLAGHLEAGETPRGGYRLSVTVPLQATEPVH